MLYNAPTGGAANDPFVGKNVAAGLQGSKVPPGAVEYPQRELVNLIAASGQTPTNTDLQQVLRAVRSGVLEFYTDGGVVNAPAIAPAPAHTVLADGLHVRVKMGHVPTGPAVFNLNSLSAPVARRGGLPLVGKEWGIGDVVDLTYSAAQGAWQICGLTPPDIAALVATLLATTSITKINLTADLYVYVRPNGSDTNSGLINDDAHAKKTVQGAWDTYGGAYFANGFAIYIVIGTQGQVGGCNIYATGFAGKVYIVGDATGLTGNAAPAQSNYVIGQGPANGLFAPYNLYVDINTVYLVGLTVDASGLVSGQSVGYGVTAGVGQVIFQNSTLKCTTNSPNMLLTWANQGGLIGFLGTTTFTGGGVVAGCFVAQYGGQYFGSFSATTATINVSNLTWAQGFAWALDRGGIFLHGLAFGSVINANGPRYSADNGDIDVFGQGQNFFPGSSAGSASNGGYYKP